MRVSTLLAAALLVLGCRAQTDKSYPTLQAKLAEKEDIVRELKDAFESQFEKAYNSETSSCLGYSGCANDLPNRECVKDWGASRGCDCNGRALSLSDPIVKSARSTSDAEEANVVCMTQGINSTFASIGTRYPDGKWQYMASSTGTLVNYPGFLFERNIEGCSEMYDPRLRPFFAQTAAPGKNVILVLDQSGSMENENRIDLLKDAAKAVINSLTHADTMNIITFSSRGASTKKNAANNFPAPAAPEFRKNTYIPFIDNITPEGATFFSEGLSLAFSTLNNSEATSGTFLAPKTFLVFLSDGIPTENNKEDYLNIVRENINRREDRDITLYAVSLGSTADQGTMKELACEAGGIFQHIPDSRPLLIQQALSSYWKEQSRRLADKQDETGELTTATLPIYDKVSYNGGWVFLGMVGTDIAGCELKEAVKNDTNITFTGYDEEARKTMHRSPTLLNCTCKSSWSYEGTKYEDKCTDDDWPRFWCATEDNCGTGVVDGFLDFSWDECDPEPLQPPTYIVDQELRSRARLNTTFPPENKCFKQYLRGDNKCDVDCSDEQLNAAAAAMNIVDVTSSSAEIEWEAKGFKAHAAGQELCGKPELDPSREACDQCPNTMNPKCSVDECNKALEKLSADGGTLCCSEKDLENCENFQSCEVKKEYVESDDVTNKWCGPASLQQSANLSSDGSGNESLKTVLAIVVPAALVLALAGTAVGVRMCRRRRPSQRSQQQGSQAQPPPPPPQAPPQSLACPLTNEPIRHPQSLRCGHTFEQINIENWLSEQSRYCPVCFAPA